MSVVKSKINKSRSEINAVYLAILALLFTYPLFRQGLWFEFNWNPYQVAVVACTLVFFIYTKLKTPSALLAPLDYSAIAFTAVYGLSIFVAADISGAVGMTMQVITYLMLYALVANLITTTKEVETLLMIFYWAGIAVVLVSLGGAFANSEGAVQNGRMYSILEYPNAFAGYVLTILLLGLYFGEKAYKIYWQLAFALGNYLCLVGFFGAKSRGAFLTMAVVFLIYILGASNYRLKIVLKTFLFTVCSYWFINSFFIIPLKHGPLYYWGLVVLLALPCLLSVFINKIDLYSKGIGNTKRIVIAVLFVLIAGIALGSKMDFLQSRFLNLSISSSGIAERFTYYQDAVEIIRDYPVLGTGGKGWDAIYKQYQGYAYVTQQLHSQFLQVWVETGLIGLAAFSAIWIVAILTAAGIMKTGQNGTRHLTWTVLCATLLLVIHSATDFNLSIPAMMIILWGLVGALRALQKLENPKEPLSRRFQLKSSIGRYLTVGFTGIVLIFSVLQVTAQNYGDQGLADFNANDFSTAKNNLEIATRLNPLASVYWAALGEELLFIASDQDDSILLNIGLEKVEKAIRLDPNNPKYYLVKGKGLLVADKIEEAVKQFETANKLAPWEQEYVDRLAETYAAVGKYYYYNQKKAKAREYLEKAVDYPGVLEKQIKSLSPEFVLLQIGIGRELVVSEKVKDASKTAAELLQKV